MSTRSQQKIRRRQWAREMRAHRRGGWPGRIMRAALEGILAQPRAVNLFTMDEWTDWDLVASALMPKRAGTIPVRQHDVGWRAGMSRERLRHPSPHTPTLHDLTIPVQSLEMLDEAMGRCDRPEGVYLGESAAKHFGAEPGWHIRGTD